MPVTLYYCKKMPDISSQQIKMFILATSEVVVHGHVSLLLWVTNNNMID